MPVKNGFLEEVTDKLAGKRPDWDSVIQNFRDNYIEGFHRPGSSERLAGKLAEIHIRQSLLDICGSDNRADFYPIRDCDRTNGYIFMYDKENVKVISTADSKPYSEMDSIITLDNLPVLFEIKIRRYRLAGRSKGFGGRNSRRVLNGDSVLRASVAGTMRNVRVDHVLDPLKKYFGVSDCGYVLVISPDQISPDSPLQKRFKESGGILVPFYTGRKAFREDVEHIKEVYNLTI